MKKNFETCSIKNEKFFGKLEIENPNNVFVEEFFCLRSKVYSFESGSENKNVLPGICKSQSKNVKFEEVYNCLVGGDYEKESDTHIIKSIRHKTYLQKVRESTFSLFDEKQCYQKEIESLPWN